MSNLEIFVKGLNSLGKLTFSVVTTSFSAVSVLTIDLSSKSASGDALTCLNS